MGAWMGAVVGTATLAPSKASGAPSSANVMRASMETGNINLERSPVVRNSLQLHRPSLLRAS